MRHRLFWTGFVFLSVFFRLAASALPAPVAEGGGRIGFENLSFLKPQRLFWSLFRLDVWQNLANTGRFSVDFDWAQGNGPQAVNRLGRLVMALTDYRLSRWKVNALAGDSQFQFTNLREKFANAFYLDVHVRGAYFSLTGPKSEISVFGGRVTRLEGLLGFSYAMTQESLFGIKMRQAIANTITLGAGFLRTQNEDDYQGIPVTKNNNIALLDAEANLSHQLTWITEFRASDYQGQTADTRTRDFALRFGPIYEDDKYHFEANYRYAGADYRFVNSATQSEQNQKGLFFQGRLSPLKWLAVFGNVDRAADTGHSGFSMLPTEVSKDLIGVSITPGRGPSLYVFYDTFNRRPNSKVPASEDFSMSSAYGELRYGGASTNSYLRFRRFSYDDRLYPQNNYEQATATAGLHKSFGAGFIVYAEGEGDRLLRAGGTRETRFTARAGFNFYTDTAFSLWGEGSFNHFSAAGGNSARNYLAAFLGLSANLPKGINVFLDVRYDQTFETFERLISPPGVRFTLRLTKRFNWGEPPRIAGSRPGLTDGGNGSVSGIVFSDANGNGVFDPGEKGLAKFSLRLEDGSSVETAADGTFQFPRVAVGEHLVSLDARHIPIEYNVLGPAQKRINVSFREDTRLNFRLVAGARLSGRVVLDENENGKADEKEPGLSDILVYLSPGGETNTFTDSNGYFEFQNLNPGAYIIKIDDLTLPPGGSLADSVEISRTIGPGENIENLVFLVREKIKMVILAPATEAAADERKTARPPKAQSPTDGSYFVLAGAFISKANALELESALSRIYDHVTVTEFNKGGLTYFRVLIKANSKKEALRMIIEQLSVFGIRGLLIDKDKST